MAEETPASAGAAPLKDAAELLISAYRALCHHPQEYAPAEQAIGACFACSAIAEVHDMMRLFASSVFEATALCAHFERELNALRAECPPRSAA